MSLFGYGYVLCYALFGYVFAFLHLCSAMILLGYIFAWLCVCLAMSLRSYVFNQPCLRLATSLICYVFALLLWMDEILHHFETMGSHCSLLFTGESSFQGFLGGAGFRPPTVTLLCHCAAMFMLGDFSLLCSSLLGFAVAWLSL